MTSDQVRGWAETRGFDFEGSELTNEESLVTLKNELLERAESDNTQESIDAKNATLTNFGKAVEKLIEDISEPLVEERNEEKRQEISDSQSIDNLTTVVAPNIGDFNEQTERAFNTRERKLNQFETIDNFGSFSGRTVSGIASQFNVSQETVEERISTIGGATIENGRLRFAS